jgi:hypothetical protein
MVVRTLAKACHRQEEPPEAERGTTRRAAALEDPRAVDHQDLEAHPAEDQEDQEGLEDTPEDGAAKDRVEIVGIPTTTRREDQDHQGPGRQEDQAYREDLGPSLTSAQSSLRVILSLLS